MKVGMVSLGCSKNRVDSEYILAALTNQGFTITADPKEAEVILVNHLRLYRSRQGGIHQHHPGDGRL